MGRPAPVKQVKLYAGIDTAYRPMGPPDTFNRCWPQPVSFVILGRRKERSDAAQTQDDETRVSSSASARR